MNKVRLHIHSLRSGVRQIDIDAPLITIGRTPSNRVCIESARVSRHHCLIQWMGDCYMLTDMGSRNGSFLNGERVQNQQIRDGDALTLGDYTIRFTVVTQGAADVPSNVLRLMTQRASLPIEHDEQQRPSIGAFGRWR